MLGSQREWSQGLAQRQVALNIKLALLVMWRNGGVTQTQRPPSPSSVKQIVKNARKLRPAEDFLPKICRTGP
jgi:hypothetical protein